MTTQAFGQSVLFRVDVPELPERERVTKHGEYDEDSQYIPPGSTVKDAAVQGYTKFFGPGAIYAMTPCSQEAAEKAVSAMQTRKISVVRLSETRALNPPVEIVWPDETDNDADDESGDELRCLQCGSWWYMTRPQDRCVACRRSQ